MQSSESSIVLSWPSGRIGGKFVWASTIERPAGSEPSRGPRKAGHLLNPSVQFGGARKRFLTSALLLTLVELAQAGPNAFAEGQPNELEAEINSHKQLQLLHHNSNSNSTSSSPFSPLIRTRNELEITVPNDAQLNAMLLAQNMNKTTTTTTTTTATTTTRANFNELEPAHVSLADIYGLDRTNNNTDSDELNSIPVPGGPRNVYQTSMNNNNNDNQLGSNWRENGIATAAGAETTQINASADTNFDETDFDDDNPLTRNMLSEYFFIFFRDRNISHPNSSEASGPSAPGELSTGNRDLLGLGVETPQLISEPPASAAGRTSGGAELANVSASHPSQPQLIGAAGAEMNPNALWVTAQDRPFWGDFFSALNAAYLPFHSVICLVICIIGIFSNVTNIIVLTRPNMITAVNTILCAIACSDLIVNLSNIPYLSHLLSDSSNAAAFFTYGWALYTLMHAHVSVTAHTISIWLTCVLATWRYFVIRSQSISQRNWSVRLALRVILAVIICVPILCIPSYLSFAILIDPPSANRDVGTTYRVGFSQLAEQSKVIRTFHFWMFSALTKLLPCVMLAFFTIVLVNKLLQARDRRLRLAQSSAGNNGTNNGSLGGQKARNSQQPAGSNLTSLDSQPGRQSIPNGRQAGGAPAPLERQHSADKKATRSHVHMIDERRLNGSNEPILDNGIFCQAQEAGPNDDDGHAAEVGSSAPRRRGTGDNLQQLARKESLRNVLMLNKRQGSHDSAANRPGPEHNNNSTHSNCDSFDEDEARARCCAAAGSGQRAPCPRTPHSSSSCATGAECLQASSCNASSNGSINISPDRLHHMSESTALPSQVFGHLLVESALSPASHTSSAMAQHRTTLISPLSPSSGTSEPAELGPPAQLNSLVAAGSEGPRSASTCGALALYAQLDTYDGNETSLRLGALTPAPAAHSTQAANSLSHGQQLTRPSLAASAQDSKVHEMEANLLARSSMSHTNLRPGGNNGAVDGRGRSIGSATFTPFQIVKLQATQRQLSQSETTTRLLIGVMIIFLICEFPAGILSALCAIFGQAFFDNVYQPMGPFTDLFALVNSAVTFILYCFMSTQFRVTFYRVVLRCPAPNVPKSANK